MDITSKQMFDELCELGADLEGGLHEMLVFNDRLSAFDNRTLRLFITLNTDSSKFEETVNVLEKLETHCFGKD